MVSDGVRTVTFPMLLNGGPVNHVVSSIICPPEVVPLTRDRAHPFGNECEDGDTIHGRLAYPDSKSRLKLIVRCSERIGTRGFTRRIGLMLKSGLPDS